jgi:aminopeptidase
MSSKSRSTSKKSTSSLIPLHAKLAQRVVNESLNLKPGESVTVETWTGGLDFAKQVVREARRVGAIPLLIYEDDEAYLFGLENTPKETIGKMGKNEYGLLSSTDAYVFIPSPLIGVYTPSIPRDLSSASTAYNSSWYEAAEKAGVRGVRLTFGYVGKDLAKILGKSPEEIIARQLKASLVSLQEIQKVGAPFLQSLVDDVEAKVQTSSNVLTFRLKGDLGIEDGISDAADVAARNNISYILPGMIWKEIDPDSANGAVAISSSVTRVGLVNGLLEFEGGKLVKWKGKDKKDQQRLDQLLSDLPEENRKLTTMIIGLNPLIAYGYAQDRFVSGSIALSGFGFTAISNKASLLVGGQTLVEKGKLSKLAESTA